MTRALFHQTLLVVALVFAGSSAASAGEIAALHRQLVESGTAPAPPHEAPPVDTEPKSGSVNEVPGVRPLSPLPRDDSALGIERIGYEAARCRGFCEAFTVIFAADGTFSYVGEANVERLGEHTGRVDRSAVSNVMRYVSEIDFRSLQHTYRSPYADVQTTYAMVDFGGDVRVVEDQGGAAPATVWALGELISSLLDDATWD